MIPPLSGFTDWLKRRRTGRMTASQSSLTQTRPVSKGVISADVFELMLLEASLESGIGVPQGREETRTGR
jgi:hypothetical protein